MVTPGGGRPTAFLDGPTGPIEYLTLGSGTPSTVFAHGLAGSITSTRPFATAVPGRRTFLHFRGHGASAAPADGWAYPSLADELLTVADHVDADACLGVSMGAGALNAVLARTPDRFERLVLVIPASLDEVPDPAVPAAFDALADLVDAGDVDGIAAHLLAEQPPQVRDDPAVVTWAAGQGRALAGAPVSAALRTIPRSTPLLDRSALALVTAPALVIGQEGDPVHDADVARELADVLPNATLEILPPGGVLWTHRARVRDLVSGFLGASDRTARTALGRTPTDRTIQGDP